MAEGKKTFIFYSDWINMIREMPNEHAGELLKHVLSYVNDENPTTENLFVKMAFGHMKPMLKSDLDKWDSIREKRKKAGAKGGKANAKQKQANAKQVEAVNDNVNVNGNVNKNVSKDIYGFSFRKSLVNLGLEKSLVDDFLKNRKLKRLANTETAFKNLVIEFNKTKIPITELMDKIVSNGWGSFKNSWLEKEKIYAQKEKGTIKKSAGQIIQELQSGTYEQ